MNDIDSDILTGLNPPQREAVETLEGPLLILAGAGSGKTRVVTRRIANLISHGAKPWEVLAITFTNKAAAEMRRRVEDLVGVPGVWLSTFHSFCARLLRREAEVLGYSQNFTIYDEDDTREVLKDLAKELNLDDKRYTPRHTRSLISRLKSQGVTPKDLPGSNYHERMLQEIYQGYQATLARNQALDFDDLLLQAVKLLRDHEEVRERYRERFKYLLVDEYQDTNGCQYELIKLLGSGHQNVCATGDPDQSIYAWRGADVRNILSFEKDFPEAKIVRLEQNYRSTKRILAVASAVIRNNKERKERELWTENAEGDPIALSVTEDAELEAYAVAAQIKRLSEEGRRLGELAIFYRTNAQSQPFEAALIHAAIPYQLVGGTPFFERREVKDALAYLRLVVNPKDDVSFCRIINVPKRGLGPATIEMIGKQAAALKCSMLEALNHTEWMERELKPKARQELYRFARQMDTFQALPPYPVEEVLIQVLEKSGLKQALESAGEEDRVENLSQLVNAANVYDSENNPAKAVPAGPAPEPGAYDGLEELSQHQASVAGFLENAALIQSTDSIKDDVERVTLMTLHMAKGLEFPFVFLAGLEEGLLPLLRSSSGPAGASEFDPEAEDRAVEEERRLFYVGVTRAREQLYLLRARSRMRYGTTERAIPSRFLDEIPEKLLKMEARAQPAWAESSAFEGFSQGERPRSGRRPKNEEAFGEFVDKAFADSVSQLNESPFEVGDRVRHELFGEGTVEDFRGSGLSAKVKIQFNKVGPKLLLLSLANLKKV